MRRRLAVRGFKVSIHAPRCRGAMRVSSKYDESAENSFNPRPPLPGGDAYRRI